MALNLLDYIGSGGSLSSTVAQTLHYDGIHGGHGGSVELCEYCTVIIEIFSHHGLVTRLPTHALCNGRSVETSDFASLLLLRVFWTLA
jgi:hypothetical protein